MNRKIYEINELYNTENDDLINLALRINDLKKMQEKIVMKKIKKIIIFIMI